MISATLKGYRLCRNEKWVFLTKFHFYIKCSKIRSVSLNILSSVYGMYIHESVCKINIYSWITGNTNHVSKNDKVHWLINCK